ncbi:MAG: Rne/Rng family ribonuclease, partial [Promicromonosporaceae bacterium]|nr:Rne/Rng family ribonuclease [Promicromonosporaceae bacterium]
MEHQIEPDHVNVDTPPTGPPTAKRSRRVTRPAGGPTFSAAPEPPKSKPLAAAKENDTTDQTRVEEPEPEVPPAPRVAATTLLFQAPDLTPRQPRRAQAPAGPPRPPRVTEPEKPAKTNPQMESEPGRVLTKAEQTASDEVRVIESEIFEQGGEPEQFAPEDLVEDTEEVQLETTPARRRGRGGRGRRTTGRGDETDLEENESDTLEESRHDDEPANESDQDTEPSSEGDAEADTSRRRRRNRGTRADRADTRAESRDSRPETRDPRDEVTALKGSTRLEAKRQRRRENRQTGRRRQIISEAEFLSHRETVDRMMVVREEPNRTQIAVLEDGILVEHYVSDQSQASLVGNIYLGRVQNVLPGMEAAFVDIGKGRNAVLYAGEVNWDAAGIESANSRRIEHALKAGDSVLVQVTKDPVGQKGARLTSQITLAGRYLVFVPEGGMAGISRKLPERERDRLKRLLRQIVPEDAGVIVRTAAAGAAESELRTDVERLQAQWASIKDRAGKSTTPAPSLLQGEPNLAIRVVRDIFNDDFNSLLVSGSSTWQTIHDYIGELAPELRERVQLWNKHTDIFAEYRVDEQLAKGLDRKVWLPSGGSLVIDRTEAMTVIDVNTGKFTGSGGTLEETVTRNNLEAAEEIVRQLRLRDIGGIIVVDFIDMVLETNRDLVLRRLVECLGRDRTKHQVAEVTSLGLIQMTRKRVGQGLVEVFSHTCEACHGRGYVISTTNGHPEPDTAATPAETSAPHRHVPGPSKGHRHVGTASSRNITVPVLPDEHSPARKAVKSMLAAIADAAAHAHEVEAAHDAAIIDDVEPEALEPSSIETETIEFDEAEPGDGEPDGVEPDDV